ncbi:hypothetical protein C8R45DRAFT_1115309 [Mycena sanguinolenta]|nr:hypothetical protein C8R45DRAFT_1115309 [Mycena sanguinolenta]
MVSPSNLSVPNNSGNPPNTLGKWKEKETTPQLEAREQEEQEERERQRVAWEQAVEDAKTLEERAVDEAKKTQQQDADQRLAESLQEEEQKEAEWKEAKRKAKVEEKRKQQEKLAKDALDEVSVQLRAAEKKELAVATHRQTLTERDARALNKELTGEDLEELENILCGEPPDNSEVLDETNDEVDSELDPNKVQTGRKRKRGGGKRSSAGKAPAKRPRKVETSRKGREVGRVQRAMSTEEIVWGPAPEDDALQTTGRRLVNKPQKAVGGTQRPRTQKQTAGREPSELLVAGPSRTHLSRRVKQLEEEMKTVHQSLVMEQQFNSWLAAEFIQREPVNKWPCVYLQSINWSPEGEAYQEDSEEEDGDEGDKEDKAPDDRKEPEDSSESELSKDSQVEGWSKEVVPEALEGERLVEEQPDDWMQVDAPVDGKMGDQEMQVNLPTSGSVLADHLPIVAKPEGIKIEVRSPEQMLINLSRQLARNWLHEQKVAKREKEDAEDVEERRKLVEKREALEKEEVKLMRRAEHRKKEANRVPSVKKEEKFHCHLLLILSSASER